MEDTRLPGSYAPTEDDQLDPQTFVPKPVEPPQLPPRLRRRKLRSLDDLSDQAKNRYEAVLIAAARARQLNTKKLALEERGLEDDVGELKRLKMTSYALDELMDGKIEVMRPEDTLES